MIEYKTELNLYGYTIIKSFFSDEFCCEINKSIEESYILYRKIQIENQVDNKIDGTVHHLLATNDNIFLDLLYKLTERDIYTLIKEYFNGNFILNSYGGVKNIKSLPSYVSNIHRDIRFFSPEFPLMLNLLIMLDDFTIDNGATYLLPGSHLIKEKPINEIFYEKSHRAIGKRGDLLIFNSNLWHAAGINYTDLERRAITLTFTKPFMKQQFDYSRLLGYDRIEKLNLEIQQILGFFSRTPCSLNEWYQKPENRFYRSNQD